MPRKKKGFQAATSVSNRVKNSRTFKLSDVQSELLSKSGLLKEQTFSSLTRSLFDEHFEKIRFFRNNPDIAFAPSDVALMIGDGVNAQDVVACLKAIVDNQPWPDVRISANAQEWFELFFNEDAFAMKTEAILKYGEIVIKDHIDIYFFHVFQRINISKMASIINQSLVTRLSDKINANAFAGAFHDFEETWLSYRVNLSLRLRFVMYSCQKYGVFGSGGAASDYFKEAVKTSRSRWGIMG